MNMQNKNTLQQKQNCIPYLDFLRFTAISMVILLHVISGVADTIPDQMTATQLKGYEIIKELVTLGVPIFLMISGALFLSPSKKLAVNTLFSKYIRRILLALVLFGSFYSLLELMVNGRDFQPVYLFLAFCNMLTGNSWAHMWYLYVLLGLYLFLPLFKTFTAHADEKTYRYLLILLFVSESILPFLEKSFHLHLGIEFPTAGIYLFYYLCGYYLHSQNLNEKKGIRISCFILAGSFAVILCNTLFFWGLDMNYDSPFIVLSAMALFFLAKNMKKSFSFCSAWRDYYFTMYLVHTFFLNLAYKLFHVTPLIGGGYLLLPVFWAGTFFLSLLSAWILLKIPVMKKYVL